MMKNVRSLVYVLALSAGSLAVAQGCGGSVETPQTQASAAQKAPVAPQTHGVVKMFGEALGDVALRPDQRIELEKLAVSADARHASMAAGKKDLMLAIADQVEKGSIDKAALQPKIDRITADLEKSRPEDSAALARMHAILDADQRNAFVDALESRFKGGHHGGKGKGGATEKGEAAGSDHHGGPMGGWMAMKQLSDELKLTDDQKTQIKDAFKASRQAHEGGARPGHDMHERMGGGKKALESFRTDTFDASSVAPNPEAVRARASEGSTHMIGIAEKVLPILTPEQRKIAADKLRTMANSGADVPFGH